MGLGSGLQGVLSTGAGSGCPGHSPPGCRRARLPRELVYRLLSMTGRSPAGWDSKGMIQG